MCVCVQIHFLSVLFAIYRDDVEVDERMFEPLYEGVHITVCGAYCAIMEFKRVCRLPFTAIAMLLQILQLLCPPGNKLPQSVYILKKFFQKYSSKSTKLRFCGSCNQRLQDNQRKCSSADCHIEPSTLIILRPDKAIRRVLTSEYDPECIDVHVCKCA